MFNSSGKDGRSAAASKARNPVVSVIGADMAVAGNVTAEHELRIDGRIDGDVRCGCLVQGAGGTIAGNIVADEATLAGLVDGGVRVRALVLEATARVTGDVTYETIAILGGARVDGRFAYRAPGEEGAEEDAPAPEERRRPPLRRQPRKGVVAELFPQAAAE